LIENHPFEAEEWWDRCGRCGLSMAAHKYMDDGLRIEQELADLPYRCPYCVDRRRDVCEHGREGALGIDMKPLNPGGN
jgi:hypothetical protein